MQESDLRAFLLENGCTVANMSDQVPDDSGSFEYRMVIRTLQADGISRAWPSR